MSGMITVPWYLKPLFWLIDRKIDHDSREVLEKDKEEQLKKEKLT